MDILLDAFTNDIVFNNTIPTATPTIQDDLAQRLKIKLQTFQGEGFLDTSIGIPYFQQIFGKGRKKATIDAIFNAAILSEANVNRIISYHSEISTARQLSVTFTVQDTTGATLPPINVSVG